ncbi:hypothetical protein HG263_13770 [Pseudoalteromonas sp. JBTF-M23]|uniref:DUF945 family protein n=1 Tax=Pseudoalteromonas caenipelagi TaxID=2726988 RepID=A0A849VFT5_9GAMM|nr:hypothetical protein [Pseudoalteromonas caenipelagi]NOU51598.1 hypothetical protein [Pseudoalteromonas caenipelagi]
MRNALLVGLGAGLVVYGTIQYWVNKTVATELDRKLTAIEQQRGVKVNYGSLDAGLLQDKVTLQGVIVEDALQRQIVSAKQVSLEGYQSSEISELTKVTFHGVKLSEFAKRQVTDVPFLLLDSQIDFTSSVSFERSTSKSEISAYFAARDILAVSLSIQMHNMTPLMEASHHLMLQPSDTGPAQLSALQSKAQEAFKLAQLHGMQLSVENQGQLRQLFTQLLLRSGLDRVSFYQMLETQLDGAQMAQRSKTAVLAFAHGLQRLDMSLQPPKGTSMGVLSEQIDMLKGEPEVFADYVNLQIKGQ